MIARASGALWLPGFKALVVSDLHLGKAERNARRGGGFWPPYENEATLTRLEAEITALSPQTVIFLGDSFDDDACVEGLADGDRARIAALGAASKMVWITGNHDPAPKGLPGQETETLALGPLTLRHIADPAKDGEISGHYHPKVTVFPRGRRIARKCFVLDSRRLILPAFGAYTGGLDVLSPVFEPLFDGQGDVILTGERALRAPMARVRRLAA